MYKGGIGCMWLRYVWLFLISEISHGPILVQSYLDYPDSVGQTHFLVYLYNPNCLDNKNDLCTGQCRTCGQYLSRKAARCYQITNFQLLADRQHDTFALPMRRDYKKKGLRNTKILLFCKTITPLGYNLGPCDPDNRGTRYPRPG